MVCMWFVCGNFDIFIYPHADSGKIGARIGGRTSCRTSSRIGGRIGDSTAQSADSTTDSVIIGPLSLLNMFDILNPLELADGSQATIGVGQRQIGLVGTGLIEFF